MAEIFLEEGLTVSLTIGQEGWFDFLVMSPFFCLYGSATGKSQSIAEQIVQQGAGKGIEVMYIIYS